MRPLLACTLVALGGCVDGTGESKQLAQPDFATFGRDAQPVLGFRCANPSCHGTADRPLELYAVHQHRADPAEVFADGKLTEQELWINFLRVLPYIDTGAPNRCELLTKPLAVAAGGVAHVGGGAPFASRTENEYRTLAAWAGCLPEDAP